MFSRCDTWHDSVVFFFAREDKPDFYAPVEKRKPCSSHASESCARELGGRLRTRKPSHRGVNINDNMQIICQVTGRHVIDLS